MSTAIQNSAPISSYFISGQHFLETFTLLPETTRTTNSWVTTTFLSSISKHDFCYTYGDISHNALTKRCTFSLRHLAAKMLSQLYNNFISFPYFFPSCETCSINVNPLFHAAIKTIIKTLRHLRSSLSFIFQLLAREQQRNKQHAQQQFFLKNVNVLYRTTIHTRMHAETYQWRRADTGL